MKLNFDNRFFTFLSEIESRSKTERIIFKNIAWILRWKIVTIPLYFIERILAVLSYIPIPFSYIIVKSMTGFAGYYFRAIYYSTRSKKWGGNIIIDEDVIFENISNYEFSEFIQIDKRVIIGCDYIRIGKGVHIAMGIIIGKGGKVYIGDYAGISYGCILIPCTESIKEGNPAGPMIPFKLRDIKKGTISINKYALVFSGSIVFPDTILFDGAVVPAGSVVKGIYPAWKIKFGETLKDRKFINDFKY